MEFRQWPNKIGWEFDTPNGEGVIVDLITKLRVHIPLDEVRARVCDVPIETDLEEAVHRCTKNGFEYIADRLPAKDGGFPYQSDIPFLST